MNNARADARTGGVLAVCRSPQTQSQTPKDTSPLSVTHLTHRYSARGVE